WDVSLDEFEPSPGEEISREEFESLWEAGPWTNDRLGSSPVLDELAQLFPGFARLAAGRELDHVLPPTPVAEVAALEERVGLPLPESYKGLLKCTRGFWLMGGIVQFGPQHPFVHEFPPLDTLTEEQKRIVSLKGGPWPPASHGMLCFAEFFMEADGDQVLF